MHRHASLRASAIEPAKHAPFAVRTMCRPGAGLPPEKARKTVTRVVCTDPPADAARTSATAAAMTPRRMAQMLRRSSVDAARHLAGELDERLGGARAPAVAVPRDPDQAGRNAVGEVDDADGAVGLVDGQARDDRDPDAGGDEPLDGAVVVRAEGDVRLADRMPEAILDALGRAAGAVRDQRLLDQLTQRRRAVARRERRAGRDDEDVGVAEELGSLVRALVDGEDDEAEVEVAAFDELEQV